MAKSTRTYKSAASLIVPQDDEAARNMLARLGEIDRDIAAAAEQVRKQVEKAKAQLKKFSDVRTDEAKTIHRALQSYFEAHQARLLDGSERKSIDWPEGCLGLRLSKPALKLIQEEALVIDALDERNLDEFLRVQISINRKAMIAALLDGTTDLLADLAEIKQREEFFASPSAEQSPSSIEVEPTGDHS
jgi:phage host-nuclease inhibitor protein Gam